MQSEFEFDESFKNYNFFSFKIACMCHYLAVVDGEFSLLYNIQRKRAAGRNKVITLLLSQLQIHKFIQRTSPTPLFWAPQEVDENGMGKLLPREN